MNDTPEAIYTYRADDPHTAIPDWILTNRKLSLGARHLAHWLIVLGKAGEYPTQDELASAIGFDRRSVVRWIEELKEAGHLSSRKYGRRIMYQLHRSSTCDSRVSDRTWDSRVRNSNHGLRDQRSLSLMSRQRTRPQKTLYEALQGALNDGGIWDSVHGGGGGADSIDRDPPTPPEQDTKTCKPAIADLQTETGRWMLREGFSLTASIELQGLELGAAQDDYTRRRQLGQAHGAIVNAWRVEAPAGSTPAPASMAGPWTFSDGERERYKAMGIAFDEPAAGEGGQDEPQE